MGNASSDGDSSPPRGPAPGVVSKDGTGTVIFVSDSDAPVWIDSTITVQPRFLTVQTVSLTVRDHSMPPIPMTTATGSSPADSKTAADSKSAGDGEGAVLSIHLLLNESTLARWRSYVFEWVEPFRLTNTAPPYRKWRIAVRYDRAGDGSTTKTPSRASSSTSTSGPNSVVPEASLALKRTPAMDLSESCAALSLRACPSVEWVLNPSAATTATAEARSGSGAPLSLWLTLLTAETMAITAAPLVPSPPSPQTLPPPPLSQKQQQLQQSAAASTAAPAGGRPKTPPAANTSTTAAAFGSTPAVALALDRWAVDPATTERWGLGTVPCILPLKTELMAWGEWLLRWRRTTIAAETVPDAGISAAWGSAVAAAAALAEGKQQPEFSVMTQSASATAGEAQVLAPYTAHRTTVPNPVILLRVHAMPPSYESLRRLLDPLHECFVSGVVDLVAGYASCAGELIPLDATGAVLSMGRQVRWAHPLKGRDGLAAGRLTLSFADPYRVAVSQASSRSAPVLLPAVRQQWPAQTVRFRSPFDLPDGLNTLCFYVCQVLSCARRLFLASPLLTARCL
jgi:hypothetical protein